MLKVAFIALNVMCMLLVGLWRYVFSEAFGSDVTEKEISTVNKNEYQIQYS